MKALKALNNSGKDQNEIIKKTINIPTLISTEVNNNMGELIIDYVGESLQSHLERKNMET